MMNEHELRERYIKETHTMYEEYVKETVYRYEGYIKEIENVYEDHIKKIEDRYNHIKPLMIGLIALFTVHMGFLIYNLL